MKPISRTKDCGLTDAEICRRNGWTVGTRLKGAECGKVDVLTITAVGLDSVLAVWEDADGDYESLTSLTCRNWKMAKEATNGV